MRKLVFITTDSCQQNRYVSVEIVWTGLEHSEYPGEIDRREEVFEVHIQNIGLVEMFPCIRNNILTPSKSMHTELGSNNGAEYLIKLLLNDFDLTDRSSYLPDAAALFGDRESRVFSGRRELEYVKHQNGVFDF